MTSLALLNVIVSPHLSSVMKSNLEALSDRGVVCATRDYLLRGKTIPGPDSRHDHVNGAERFLAYHVTLVSRQSVHGYRG